MVALRPLHELDRERAGRPAPLWRCGVKTGARRRMSRASEASGTDIQTASQPRPAQGHRARPDGRQREATGAAPPLLQVQEVPPAGPPAEADARHPPPPVQGRFGEEAGQSQEAPAALPATEICRQGELEPVRTGEGAMPSIDADSRATPRRPSRDGLSVRAGCCCV